MKSKVELLINGRTFDYKHFIFSGGEISVKLNENVRSSVKNVIIKAYIKDSDGIMTVLMLKDAINRFDETYLVDLWMPYIPYARQDRMCDQGEAFSLKVFAQLINNAKFNAVLVHDPHSDVSTALIDNCFMTNQDDLMDDFMFGNRNSGMFEFVKNSEFVSPDSGANKKILKSAARYNKKSFIRGDKIRDPKTGKIIETSVYGEVPDKVLIIDDICDKGGTFIALAKVLKERGAKEVGLYVTHGIFSAGIDHLTNNGIDHVWAYHDWTKG